jgi:hypothetical protein
MQPLNNELNEALKVLFINNAAFMPLVPMLSDLGHGLYLLCQPLGSVTMACSAKLDFHVMPVPASSRILKQSFMLAILGLFLLLPTMASAQQGQCFKDSNGKKVCCDANGNCK